LFHDHFGALRIAEKMLASHGGIHSKFRHCRHQLHIQHSAKRNRMLKQRGSVICFQWVIAAITLSRPLNEAGCMCVVAGIDGSGYNMREVSRRVGSRICLVISAAVSLLPISA
jgi:hypothetical protein